MNIKLTKTPVGFIPIDPSLCECGCGNLSPIAKKTSTRRGVIKGQALRFISGHNARVQPRGRKAYRWNGGIKTNYQGRILIYKPDHHRAYADGYVLRAVFLVERILQKPLPTKAVIHHCDENPGNDNYPNLVICENRGYHLLLHQRLKAYKKTGHATWRKCRYCKQYDEPDNLYISPGNDVNHLTCYQKYRKRWANQND